MAEIMSTMTETSVTAASPGPSPDTILERLRCCEDGRIVGGSAELRCTSCGRTYAVIGDILDLRPDPSMDTALDLDTYDDHHAVSEENARTIYKVYGLGLDQATRPLADGQILEIGSGTGNLTIGLARFGPFAEIHCSDISLRFMQALDKKLTPSDRAKIRKYLLDANVFPFRDQTFDAVVGSSILHHLINFENTLAEAHRVLRPGGVAVFGEPMMETRALVYLAAEQILAVDDMLPEPRLNKITRNVLKSVAGTGALKMRNLLNRDAETQAKEDKFVFPENHMRETARRLGYSDYKVVQYAPVEDAAEIVRRELRRIVGPTHADLDAVLSFDAVIAPFKSAYQASLGRFMGQTFAMNVFVR